MKMIFTDNVASKILEIYDEISQVLDISFSEKFMWLKQKSLYIFVLGKTK